MTESHTSPPTQKLLTKILVIIGFAVTIVAVVWLSIQGIRRLPNAFSSLASMAESIQKYPTTQKTTPPNTTSSSTPNEYTHEEEVKEDIGTSTNTQSTEAQNFDTETTNSIQIVSVPEEPKHTPPAKTTTIHPYSNPNGYVDLSVITLGSGALRHGTFVLTPRYDINTRNAIQFTIKNIGTKTSGTWGFETIFPSGNVYESGPQFPLKPHEQVTFTLGFDLERTRKNFVEIRNTVYTQNDTNSKNNSSVWTVATGN